MDASPIDTLTLRPARALLAAAVTAARAAHSGPKAERRKAAKLAAAIPDAVRAVLREEAVRHRLRLAIDLEQARRCAVELAGLEAVLGISRRDAVAIVGPALLGEPGRVLLVKPEEIAAAAAVWRGYGEALGADPTAEAAKHLRFADPPSAASGAARRGAPAASVEAT